MRPKTPPVCPVGSRPLEVETIAPPTEASVDAAALDDVTGTPALAGATNPERTTGTCPQSPGQLFPPAAPWNTPVSTAALDAESQAIIGYLDAAHTDARRFQINYSLRVLTADPSTPRVPFVRTKDFYEPACDPAPMPLPKGGALEGQPAYECVSDGDCHLLVVDWAACRLYEMWRANLRGGTLYGGCLAVWDLGRVYPPTGRGEACTSADAGGLPISPLLFTADEVAAGEIRHAIRLIVPNALIRERIYVRPATHSTGATKGPSTAPPYGARFRLKASKNLGGLNPAARIVAQAMQRYGMVLVDGGNVSFTAANDADAKHKWAAVGLGPHDLKSLRWSDFEVVEGGRRFHFSGGCRRTQIMQ